jgi:hypothetical protein
VEIFVGCEWHTIFDTDVSELLMDVNFVSAGRALIVCLAGGPAALLN